MPDNVEQVLDELGEQFKLVFALARIASPYGCLVHLDVLRLTVVSAMERIKEGEDVSSDK